MLLAVDAGNTQTVVGLFDGDELVDHWRIATKPDRTSDEHALLLRQFVGGASVDGLAIASVVPPVTAALRELADRYFHLAPVVVEPGTRTGMPILYDNPRQVGADRIANAVAAYDLYGGPTIIVDFGTATTVDAVSAEGEYVGGAIMPGIEVSLEALFDRAAALFRVELVEPRNVIGKNTAESIQSGALYGTGAQVDGLCRRFQEELGPCTVVATGGLAALIAPYSAAIQHHQPWLTLQGLRLVYERNAGPGR
ncbi:MAG: type III pantothenate kinase [Acidimicrobiales bacterium]